LHPDQVKIRVLFIKGSVITSYFPARSASKVSVLESLTNFDMRYNSIVNPKSSFVFQVINNVFFQRSQPNMQSEAATVTEYLKEVPEDRLPALTQIQRLCQQHLSEFEESMEYGMPSYSRSGTVEVAFASQKNNISLYILRTDVLNPYRDRFPKSSIGKGCIRYHNPDKIDFELIEEMLIKTNASTGEVC
jgi:uncharacterized protein YdhG (YjbR/CyaY superfamily)